MDKYCFGVDLGGTTVKIGLFSIEGQLQDKWEIPTRTENHGAEILSDIAASIQRRMDTGHLSKEQVTGIGIGVPGPVLNENIVQGCVNLGWGNVRVADELSALTGLKVKAANDANVAALGEQWQGGGKGFQNLVMFTLGTGVGGGIIQNGRIISGANGAAGEIGHMTVNPGETQPCSCGKRGCLEQYASAGGSIRLAQAAGLRVESAKDVSDLAAWGNERAQGALKKAGRLLGLALSNAACLVDVDGILLGGGVAAAGEALLSPVRDAFYANVFHAAAGTQVALASLGNDAGMYGAVRLALGSQSATTAL